MEELFFDIQDKYYDEFMKSLDDFDMSLEEKKKQRDGYVKGQILTYDLAVRREAFRKSLVLKYKKFFDEEMESYEKYFPILKIQREREEDKFKSNYLFITINPRPSILWPEFMKICLKVVTKPWINKYLCVFEQRGDNDDEIGKGFHFHLLLDKGDYRWSHARREFVSSFNKVCDIQNYHTFNFTLCKESDLKNRQNYMLEMKADPEKHLKQEYDKKWRKIYNLPEYYGVLFCERKGG